MLFSPKRLNALFLASFAGNNARNAGERARRPRRMTRARTSRDVTIDGEWNDLPASEDVALLRNDAWATRPFAVRSLACRVSPKNRAAILPARQSDETTRSHAFLPRQPRGESFDFNGIPSIVGARRSAPLRCYLATVVHASSRIEITRANWNDVIAIERS